MTNTEFQKAIANVSVPRLALFGFGSDLGLIDFAYGWIARFHGIAPTYVHWHADEILENLELRETDNGETELVQTGTNRVIIRCAYIYSVDRKAPTLAVWNARAPKRDGDHSPSKGTHDPLD